MSISNCLFSPTYENPLKFSVRCVLTKLFAKSRNKPYTNTLELIGKMNTINYNILCFLRIICLIQKLKINQIE